MTAAQIIMAIISLQYENTSCITRLIFIRAVDKFTFTTAKPDLNPYGKDYSNFCEILTKMTKNGLLEEGPNGHYKIPQKTMEMLCSMVNDEFENAVKF